MAVTLPFELPLYQRAGVPASFVGHPMAGRVVVDKSKEQAAVSFGLDPARKIVGLFPGSRKSEISRLLPTIIAAADLLLQRFPNLQFVLPLASTLNEADLAPYLAASNRLQLKITRERIHDLARACDAVISVSGTVTLEVALVGTPLLVIYKLSPLTFQLAKRLVKVEHIGLCNIVAGETVAKELIQDNASPQNIASEIENLLTNEQYAQHSRHKLSLVSERLGNGGTDEKMAQLTLQLLEKS